MIESIIPCSTSPPGKLTSASLPMANPDGLDCEKFEDLLGNAMSGQMLNGMGGSPGMLPSQQDSAPSEVCHHPEMTDGVALTQTNPVKPQPFPVETSQMKTVVSGPSDAMVTAEIVEPGRSEQIASVKSETIQRKPALLVDVGEEPSQPRNHVEAQSGSETKAVKSETQPGVKMVGDIEPDFFQKPTNGQTAGSEVQPIRIGLNGSDRSAAQILPDEGTRLDSAHGSIPTEANTVSAGNIPAMGKPESIEPVRVQVVQQIIEKMDAAIHQGKSSLRIQLNPQDLGGIDIRLTHTSSGIHISLVADQAGTGRLLEAQLEQLKQSLNQAGVQLANLELHQEGRSGQQEQLYQFHRSSPLQDGKGISSETGEQWVSQRTLQLSQVNYLV